MTWSPPSFRPCPAPGAAGAWCRICNLGGPARPRQRFRHKRPRFVMCSGARRSGRDMFVRIRQTMATPHGVFLG
ncbi:hypothetical protein GCM10009767_22950 [Kocuria aegyptia]|uniref:Uncharacterized protein n=1 Tax=Kocuria aegyptia TaxID=330943 RepID=A0ABN2KR20_9MICC